MQFIFFLALLTAGCPFNSVAAYLGMGRSPITRIMERDGGLEYYRQTRPGDDHSDGRILSRNESLVVGVSADIKSIDFTNGKDDILNVDLVLRQEWVDPRLQHSYNPFVSLSGDLTDEIWSPDTHIVQSLREEVRHKFATVEPNGAVVYSTRIRVGLSCPHLAMCIESSSRTSVPELACAMDLASRKPNQLAFETSSHPLSISVGYTSDNVVYRLRKGTSAKFTSTRYSNALKIRNVKTSDCTEETVTGSYSCIRLEINLDNKFV